MYTPKTFAFNTLDGISQKQLDVHIKLYEGYVKFINVIDDQQKELMKDSEKNAYALAEVTRRIGFEFNGMRMHEYYFEQFEGSAQTPQASSTLQDLAGKRYGNWEKFIDHIEEISGTRGIGWVVVYFDPKANLLHTTFVGDHELGQLAGLPIILALDLWEHAYMIDYAPAEKSKYIDVFLSNMNWGVVEERLIKI